MATLISNPFNVTVSTTGTNLSWSKPTTLANGDALPVDAIAGYKIYKESGGTYSLYDIITDQDTLSASVSVGSKYAVATTYANGQSPLSYPVEYLGHAAVADATIVGPGEDYEYSALQTAINNASAGDTIYIRGGTINRVGGANTWHTLSTSGTSGNPITIASYPGEWAIIEGWGGVNDHPNAGGNISGITKGNPTTFTTSADNKIVDGATVAIADIVDDGPGGDIESTFNDNSYTATVTGSTTFTVAVDSSGLTNAWSSGGRATVPSQQPTGGYHETLFLVTGDYWLIRDLEFRSAQGVNVQVSGNYIDIEYCYSHNAWLDNIFLGDNSTTLTDVSVKFCEVSYGLHGSGIVFRPLNNRHSNFTCDHILTHHNGYLESSGLIAQPAVGDAAGGGNSDGMAIFKAAETNANPTNLMDSCHWKNVFAWNNADDNFDYNAGGDGWMLNCWGWDAGPQGKKFLKNFLASNEDRTVVGCWAGESTIGGTNVYELRQAGDYDFYNNQVMHTSTYGIRADGVAGPSVMRNFLSHGNGNIDVTASFDTLTNNHFNTDPTPDIATPTFSKPTVSFPVNAQNLRTNFWSRWNHLYRQVQQAMMPTPGGSIVNSGYLQSGIHSATAADDAETPADPEQTLMLWTKAISPTDSTGTAPDIGAVQYTYINPPDDVSIS